MTSPTQNCPRPRFSGRGAAAALAPLCAFLLVACADGPAAPGAEPSAERTETTPVDTAVIRDGVFTARLEEPWMNQSGFTVYPVGLHVRNAGTERLVGRLHDTPVCTYWVQLYWTSARSVPVWPPPAEAEPAVCAGTNTEFEIESGGEESVSNATRFTNGLVGDSLPEGWYHPTLTIAPFGVLTELKVDSVHLMPR